MLCVKYMDERKINSSHTHQNGQIRNSEGKIKQKPIKKVKKKTNNDEEERKIKHNEITCSIKILKQKQYRKTERNRKMYKESKRKKNKKKTTDLCVQHSNWSGV